MRDPEPENRFLRVVLDALPTAVFVVDADVRMVDANQAGRELLGDLPAGPPSAHRAGELLHCLHATETAAGCGHAPACRECVIRGSVGEAVSGRRNVRRRTRMTVMRNREAQEVFFLITTAPFRYADQDLVLLVLEDISEYMELRRIVPICAQCKKVRSDEDYWSAVEQFMARHLDLTFSHSYCPECLEAALEEAGRWRERRQG
jgi:PAS domain-containing protein